jgi:hypothetical protein
MTIITECPACDMPAFFEPEPDDRRHGWFPHVCIYCAKVMWVEKTTLAGTTYSSEDFFAKIVRPGDVETVRAAEEAAIAEALADREDDADPAEICP